MSKNKKYRIAYKSLTNGQTGAGNGCFSKEEAESRAKQCNKIWDKAHHWAEPVPEKKKGE